MPEDDEQAAAEALRAIGFTVRWYGEFWLVRDDRGEPAMSARCTREELLEIARREAKEE